MISALRSVYSRAVPLRHRLAIGQLRRVLSGKVKVGSAGELVQVLRLDHADTARWAWEKRDDDGGEKWTREYWNQVDAPQRRVLIETLRGRPAFRNVLELGCNAGPNLRLVREHFPQAQVTGVDLSASAIERAHRHFAEIGLGGATFRQGSFDRVLPTFADRSFDVVIAVWSLCCCPPSEIGRIMDDMVRVGRSFVIIEPMVIGDRPGEIASALPTWKHNYQQMLRQRGVAAEAHPVQLDHIDHFVVGSRT